MVKLGISLLSPTASIPYKAHEEDAAYDIKANDFMVIPPGAIGKVGTGFVLEIPNGWQVNIYSRSGLASKGIQVANQPAIIDAGFLGEIMVCLYNTTLEPFTVRPGDRIAQMEANPIHQIQWDPKTVDEMVITKRGQNGLGSTGI